MTQIMPAVVYLLDFCYLFGGVKINYELYEVWVLQKVQGSSTLIKMS